MKRILSTLFVIVLLVAALTLVSCTDPEPMPPHTVHQFVDTVVEPVCETNKAGYTVHTCSVCDYSYTDSYVEAHQFISVVVPATCHDLGYVEHTCELCGYVKRDNFTETTDPTNHVLSYPNDYWNEELAGTSIIVEVVDSTCKDYGYSTYKCVYHQDVPVKGDIVDKLADHTYGEWNVITESTCSTEGFKERSCTVCNVVDQEIIPYADHIWDEYEFVVDEIHLNALYEERSCIACKTTEANPVIIEDVLSLELHEDESGKYYVVTGINQGKNVDTVVIPAFMYLDGEKVPVREIKANAFMYNDDIKVIYIPDSIIKIGIFAFTGCTSVIDIYYGGSITEWEAINKVQAWDYAFDYNLITANE